MNTPIYLDSSKIRNNFADILNSVFNEKKTYIVKKSGIPVAKISSIENINNKDEFLNFAGLLTNKEGKKLLKSVKTGRSDKSKAKIKLV